MEQLSLLNAPETPPGKQCTKCGKTKPLDAFTPDKRHSTGRASACRDCGRDAARAHKRRHVENNRDRVNELARVRRTKNPDASKTAQAKWRRENRDYDLERKAHHRDQLRDELNAKARDYKKRKRAEDPAAASTADASKRAKKRDAWIEDVDRSAVWERDGGRCHLCSLPADPSDWHLDHIVPIAKGGAHSYLNCAVSHPRCNTAKRHNLMPSALGYEGEHVEYFL